MIFLIATISLLIALNVYFKIADHFNIIDKPNERSLHVEVTIRGGGIIFYLAFAFYFFYSGFQFPLVFAGVSLISFISFLDDIYDLSRLLRILVHFTAMALLMISWQMDIPIWMYIPIFILATGILNAYNFMDGINGITGTYSFVTLVSMIYINYYVQPFIDVHVLYFMTISTVIFNLYNFRKKAKCFAGDIGSTSISFIIIFLLGKLMITSQNFGFLLLLTLYGIDSIITIVQRLLRKENIFKAHKTHLFQYLVHAGGWSHLSVTTLYGVLQLLVNIFVIWVYVEHQYMTPMYLGLLVTLLVVYIVVKLRLMNQSEVRG